MPILCMITVNSTTVLEKLRLITANDSLAAVDIKVLADCVGIAVPALISVLTELEHRDEIKLDISTMNTSGEPQYSGSVRLMDTPPDEQEVHY